MNIIILYFHIIDLDNLNFGFIPDDDRSIRSNKIKDQKNRGKPLSFTLCSEVTDSLHSPVGITFKAVILKLEKI